MKTTLLFLIVFLSANLFGQNVYIPDANFKASLVGYPLINTNGDTEIQVSEASAFDGTIYCPSENISDMTGIEAFTVLTQLFCFDNQLTSLDLSQNTALDYLDCASNQLTNLDLSQNTVLTQLFCYDNQLTSLDLSQNTALDYLDCASNQLTNLDLSQNTVLTQLLCFDNQLTSLDLSDNTSLMILACSYNQITSLNLSQNFSLKGVTCSNNQLTCLNVANGNNTNFYSNSFFSGSNPNLTCIQVDNAAWSTSNWTNIAPQQYFSEDCGNDCTTSLTELSTFKNLIQILDLMGRETTFKPNTPLIYVYDDGSTEKVFTIE